MTPINKEIHVKAARDIDHESYETSDHSEV